MTAPILLRRALLAAALLIAPLAAQAEETKFKRVPLQYIAALAAPEATSGTGAQDLGHLDHRPRPTRHQACQLPQA